MKSFFLKLIPANIVFTSYLYKSEPVGANNYVPPSSFSLKVFLGRPNPNALISETELIASIIFVPHLSIIN